MRWLHAERDRDPWRRAHKVVEWDGWEEGLVGMILNEEIQQLDGSLQNGLTDSPRPSTDNALDGPTNYFNGVGSGGFVGVGLGANRAFGGGADNFGGAGSPFGFG